MLGSEMRIDQNLCILGINGSLRRESFNRKLLKAVVELLPEGVTIEVFELHDIPLYNGDVEAEGLPEAVVAFREKIRGADAILIATPEYNYSVAGVLKNAIDWASRPPDPPFNGKPVAIMGASPGAYGTVRAQGHLRQVLQCLNTRTMPRPEFMLSSAQEKLNASGNLTDEKTRKLLSAFLSAFIEWIKQVGKGRV